MTDDTIFETRLAAALGHYAELAPSMDDGAIAEAAIAAYRPGAVARWVGALRMTSVGPSASRGLRLAYLVALLALLVAALIIAAVVGGAPRDEIPLPAGRNGLIVYSFTGTGHEAVSDVAIDADGTGVHPIDAGRCPTYSMDGSVLAWLSYEGSAAKVASASPDGSPAGSLLLVDPVERPVPFALSPDGTKVAWLKPSSPGADSTVDVWVAPLDGGPGRAARPGFDRSRVGFTIRRFGHPTASGSPSGSTSDTPRPANPSGSRLEVVNADGSGHHRLTKRRGLLEDGFAWSPDSKYLAYPGLGDGAITAPSQDTVLGELPRDLYLIAIDGTGERRLTDTPATEHDPGWSQDGAFLGFETSLAGAADRVTTLGMGGAAPVGSPLLGPESEWFAWSPDGQLLLWQTLTMVARETYRTTLHAIDREFERPATTVQVVEGLVICAPTWQRLTP